MIDEEIIASAKKIILRKSKKDESNDVVTKLGKESEPQGQIQMLLVIIKQQEQHLRRLESNVDVLLKNN